MKIAGFERWMSTLYIGVFQVSQIGLDTKVLADVGGRRYEINQ